MVGAILAPTDAALGQAVVSNSQVPGRARRAMIVESGLNDGLALPAGLLFASLAAKQWIATALIGFFLGQTNGPGPAAAPSSGARAVQCCYGRKSGA